MTTEATIAREIALQMEVKLDALRRNQDGSVKLTLTVNPDDFPMQLMTDPLGQRYVCVMVAKNDDESPKVSALAKPAGKAPEAESTAPPVAGKERWSEMLPSKQAALLCCDSTFFQWIISTKVWEKEIEDTEEESSAKWLRQVCTIASRSDLNRDQSAREEFNRIQASFDMWKKGYGVE